MFISVIDELIPAESLKAVQDILSSSDFVDGRFSGGDDLNKNNLELPYEKKQYVEALRLVEGCVRENFKFNHVAFPRAMSRPIFSMYDVGMFYDKHYDYPILNFMAAPSKAGHKGLAPVGFNYVRSDLSMTIFLAGPDDYDGGELFFPGPQEQLLMYKLKAGSAVIYPTGAEHGVRLVTRGARLAAIFWIQSLFPAEATRKLACDSSTLSELLKASRPSSPEAKLAEENFFGILRAFAEV